MDLSLTGEQNELLSWADTVLPVEFALDRFNGIEGALQETALDKLAELGWYGMAVPEPAGGSGMSVLEEMLLMKEAGKHLASPSLLATVVAVHDAVANGDNALAQELMACSKRASLAIASEKALLALDADEADLLVAFGRNAVTLQPTDGLARLGSAGTPLDDSLSLMRYGIGHENVQVHAVGARLWMRAQILLAASQVGLGEAATDMAVEYAKIREQFGSPIGAFQAIKHKCADMALHLTAARSQLIYAAAAFNERLPEAEYRILCAGALAETASLRAAFDNVQVHGGIGFTSECHAQRFVKRATVLQAAGSVNKRYREQLLAGAPEPSLSSAA